MASLPQVALSLVGLTGAGAVVGVPVALHVQGQTSDISGSHEGREISQVSVFMEKCSNSDQGSEQEINFGSQTQEKVCWTVDKSSGASNVAIAEDQKYTDLFKKMWGNPNGSWSSGTNYWTTSCSQNKWTFSSQQDGSESLGLCEGSQSPNKWLMVKNESSSNTTVEVCAGVCFNEGSASNYKTLDTSKKAGTWSQIKFWKSN